MQVLGELERMVGNKGQFVVGDGRAFWRASIHGNWSANVLSGLPLPYPLRARIMFLEKDCEVCQRAPKCQSVREAKQMKHSFKV